MATSCRLERLLLITEPPMSVLIRAPQALVAVQLTTMVLYSTLLRHAYAKMMPTVFQDIQRGTSWPVWCAPGEDNNN